MIQNRSRFEGGWAVPNVQAFNRSAPFNPIQAVQRSTTGGNFHVSRIPERIPRPPCTGLAETVQVNGQYSNLENLPVPQLAQRLA